MRDRQEGGGSVFSSLIATTGRNPNRHRKRFSTAILGFALTAAITLFA